MLNPMLPVHSAIHEAALKAFEGACIILAFLFRPQQSEKFGGKDD